MLSGTFLIVLYALFLASRINGCVRRWRQPLVRGRDWFFNVPVRVGFYDGAGARLLAHYRFRMLLPFAVELPLATYLIVANHAAALPWLILGLSALIHINHHYSVAFAERQAPGRGRGAPSFVGSQSVACAAEPWRLFKPAGGMGNRDFDRSRTWMPGALLLDGAHAGAS